MEGLERKHSLALLVSNSSLLHLHRAAREIQQNQEGKHIPSLTWTTMYGAVSLNQISRAGNRGDGLADTGRSGHTLHRKSSTANWLTRQRSQDSPDLR